nr:hypothetical protein [Tanacetum cinerariifolium]
AGPASAGEWGRGRRGAPGRASGQVAGRARYRSGVGGARGAAARARRRRIYRLHPDGGRRRGARPGRSARYAEWPHYGPVSAHAPARWSAVPGFPGLRRCRGSGAAG